MQSQEFKVIYDILQEGSFSLNGFLIVWLLIAGILNFFFFFSFWKDGFKIKSSRNGFTLVLLPIFLIIGLFANINTYSIQKGCLEDARNSNFEIIEGQIKNLKTSSKSESFSVNGVKFVYNEYDASKCGYRQVKGRKLENDKLVRISYHNGCILKFEIAKQQNQ